VSFVPRTLEELAVEWPSQLDHISATSVKMAARCPEQWRQRYVLRKKMPPAAVLLQGRADHAAIEFSMRQKLTTQMDIPVLEVRDLFLAAFEQEIENEGGIGELEVRGASTMLQKTRQVDDMKRDGMRNVANYHSAISPQIQPLAVEEEFALQVKDLPVTVIGKIDLRGNRKGRQVLIDRKGSGRPRYKPEPEWTIQAEVYQLVRPLNFEWHITNTPNGQLIMPDDYSSLWMPVVARERAERTLQQIVAEIGHYMRTYGPDGEWPTRGKLHTWACGYCGFRPDCWGWK
jgi:hypothetical protein